MTKMEDMNSFSFGNIDKFDRKKFADRLTTILLNFFSFYESSFVLSLNAKFGSGKTTFFKMWKHELEASGYRVIYINAWETDFDNEPLVPLISALIEEVEKKKKLEPVLNAFKGALGATTLATSHVIKHITGVDIEKITDQVITDIEANDIRKIGAEIYKEYAFKKDAYYKLKTGLATFVKTLEKQPLIILVDELDRVRPNYAVKFLEAIKHFFSIQGVCFVLGVDRNQLKSSIAQLYGDIDFENYYRRFVTREASLPEVSAIDLMPFLQHQASDFFDEKRKSSINFPFTTQEQPDVLQFINIICQAFQFSPREIESLFRIFSQFMAVTTDKKALVSWVKAAALLIAFSIRDPDLYKKIGTGNITPAEFHSNLKTLKFRGHSADNNARYLAYIALSFLIRSNPEELKGIADIFFDYDGVSPEKEDLEKQRTETIRHLSRVKEQFGRIGERSGYESIYEMLEEWRPFIE